MFKRIWTHGMISLDETIPPFVPTDIAGCVLWLRSDWGITKDGSNKVAFWADKSNNGNTLGQGILNRRPLWVDAQLNGYPSISFMTEGQENSNLYKDDMVLTSPYTVFLVYKNRQIGSLNNNDCIFAQASAAWGYYQSTTSSLKNFLYDGAFFAYTDGSIANNEFAIVCGKFNVENSALYEDGILRASGTLAGTAGSGFTLGSQHDGLRPSYIDVVEVTIYNSILSDPNRVRVENYFNGRYVIY